MTRAPPVLRVALGFAAGAAIAPAAPASLHGGFSTPLLLALLILAWQRPAIPLVGALISLAAGLVWATAGVESRRVPCLVRLSDRAEVRLEGFFVQARERGASEFRVMGGLEDECAPTVRVYARGEGFPEARFGDLVGRWVRAGSRSGRGGAGPGYVSAGRFDEAQGRVPLSARSRASLRRRARTSLEERFGPRAGTAGALILADGDGVEPSLREAFVRAGAAHLLSISGFHVGVVAGLLAGAATLAGLPPKARAIVVSGGVWSYVAVIGLPTSAARAAWMATALVLGTLRGRPVLKAGALGFAMLLLALLDPLAVSGPGYQLTVAGTAGILVLGRWALRHWPDRPRWAWLGPSVAAGIGASVFTVPILALHFGELSLLTLPSSLLLTPLVATAIPGIMAVLVWDSSGLPFGEVVAFPVDGLLLAIEGGAVLLGGLPWATLTVTPAETALAVGGGWVGLWALRAPWTVPAWARVWLAVCAGGAALLGAQAARGLVFRNTVEVTAIDVGQGDAIAIRTPRGRWLLVDGGPKGRNVDAGASRVVPFLHSRGVGRLEAVVLSHPDEDHAGGLESVLEEFPTRVVLGPGRTVGQRGQLRALELARKENVPWRRLVTGDQWTVDGVDIRVLHPGNEDLGDHPNDWSTVLWIQFGDFDALLMGDAERAVEERILSSLPDGGIEVLKAGHHGSRTSTSKALVDRVRPDFVLISAGRRNRYGHPAPAVMRRLVAAGATVLRTDVQGTVGVLGTRDGRVRPAFLSW